MVIVQDESKLWQFIEEKLLHPGYYGTITIQVYDGCINNVKVERSLNLKEFGSEEPNS